MGNYKIEGGLIVGPDEGKCAGYILNFAGHGSYDPTGKIKVGDLELTQEQVDTHNNLLSQAEIDHMKTKGVGLFYVNNDKVSNFNGTFKSPWAYVKHGYSYGFTRVQTRWVWFTGPDGKRWYGVNKGDQSCFTGKRLKTSAKEAKQ